MVLVDFKSLINGRLDVFWTRPLEVIPVDFIIGPGENGFSFFCKKFKFFFVRVGNLLRNAWAEGFVSRSDAMGGGRIGLS